MKIGHIFGIATATLLVIIIAALIYVFTSLDTLVAGLIQKYGSQVTRTPVRVSSLSIDLKTGTAGMQQLSIGNPAGFSAPDIFTLGNINTRVDLDSIGKDPIIIEEIRIDKPAVFYEINKVGQSNLKELEKNIAKATGGGEAAADDASAGGPKLVIRKLVIEGGTIDARVAALGDESRSADLPRIQLDNIGDPAAGGASGADVTRQVIKAIIARVGPAVTSLGLDKFVGKNLDEAKSLLEGKVGGQLDDTLGDKAREGKQRLQDLLGD